MRRRRAFTISAAALMCMGTACNAVLGNQLGHLDEPTQDAAPEGSNGVDGSADAGTSDSGALGDASADSAVDRDGPWNPADFGTALSFWLDGDRGISTTICGSAHCAVIWTDESGNGNDARPPYASAAPIIHAGAYNGHTALTFDGATTSLSIDDSLSSEINGGFALFAVAATAPSSAHPLGDIYSKTGDPLPFAGPGLFANYSMGGVDGSDGRVGTQVDFYQFVMSQETHLDDGALRVYSTTFDGTSVLTMRVNAGVPSTLTTAKAVTPGTLRAAGIASSVGGRLGTQQLFLGDIAELILVTRAITPAEWTDAYKYLKTKYALP